MAEEVAESRQVLAPVKLRDVTKLYRHGRTEVRALDDLSVEFRRHSFTAVMGPSGSGKSTLLHCAAGLERPTSGTVRLAAQDIGRLSEKRLTRLRRARVGFVFQALNLVPALDVRENVLLPLRLTGTRWDRKWPDEILRRVGLEDWVRVARALQGMVAGHDPAAEIAAPGDYRAALNSEIAQNTWTIRS